MNPDKLRNQKKKKRETFKKQSSDEKANKQASGHAVGYEARRGRGNKPARSTEERNEPQKFSGHYFLPLSKPPPTQGSLATSLETRSISMPEPD